ncbi:hypothetical protein BGZ58_006397 [Dissophora ornata]|nr:hypothetical protein BGZ58_006397 [Dissophora ornata]
MPSRNFATANDDETPTTPKLDAGRVVYLLDTLKQSPPYKQAGFETYLLRLLAAKRATFDFLSCDFFQDMMAHVDQGFKVSSTDSLQQKLDDTYFLETAPENYSSDAYSASLRGTTVHDKSTEKRLQNEWWSKLMPKLKESKDGILGRGLRRHGSLRSAV